MPAKMRSKKRAATAVFSMKTLGVAVASALLFSNAHAAALGKITVLSALGQPLRAEIALRAVSEDEASSLSAKLASPETFRQANIEFNPALLSLKFSVEKRAGQQFIRVISNQPLNEPFVDMLVELSSPDNRLVREYTFLLDPADLRTMQPAQVAPVHVPQAAHPVQPSRQTPVAPAASVQAAPNAGDGSNRQPAEYRVKSGDTLAAIAGKYDSGVSLDQMLVALYRANPDAFIEKNMNRMKAGVILSVPSAESAAVIGKGEAHNVVVAQAADFNRYRSMLASHVASGEARSAAEGGQSASGKITAKIEEKATPANESKDKLKLSNALAAKGGADAAGAGETAEDRIAREKALEEANNRIKELERNVGDLQKILEMKNRSLAEQQKLATTVKPAAPAIAAKPAPAPVTKAKPAAPAAAPESSLMDEVLGNSLVLPGVGALLVLLGALGIYAARRKKRTRPFEDSIITDSSLKANSLFGSTGGQSVDTNNSVFNSSFSPSASNLDSNEVDPVAEADVYIAYGRDAQAEEILKEALRTQPERHAVRVKLLEIYSNRKDLRAFEVLATELYGMTRGEGEEWKQAAAMGAAIDPNNPLYAGAQATVPGGGSSAADAEHDDHDDHELDGLLDAGAPLAPTTGAHGLQMESGQFSGGTLAAEPTDAAPVVDVPERDVEAPKPSTNELDFDLDGMMPELEVPNTVTPPVQPEPAPEMASIDFDFLDTTGGQSSPSVQESAGSATSEADEARQIDELPALQADVTIEPALEAALEEPAIDMPESQPVSEVSTSSHEEAEPLEFALPDAGVATEATSAQADPLDFDLSGISLELDPGMPVTQAPTGQLESSDAVTATIESSSDAEMATKLDLALAYQEIGDKEGARELLDEVLKGGSVEQSERAKVLLLELA